MTGVAEAFADRMSEGKCSVESGGDSHWAVASLSTVPDPDPTRETLLHIVTPRPEDETQAPPPEPTARSLPTWKAAAETTYSAKRCAKRCARHFYAQEVTLKRFMSTRRGKFLPPNYS